MNGEAQRARHTAVSRLESDMDGFAGEVETLLENFARELQTGIAALKNAVDDERIARQALDRELHNCWHKTMFRQSNFEHRSFWQRVNWFLTGR